MADSIEHQREVTHLLLSVIEDEGFALAGSGAIREHGLTSRPTEDVDLFTARTGAENFSQAITKAISTLRNQGYEVAETRRAEKFAHLHITAPDGHVLEVDFGLDWRGAEPVHLDVGPVLALSDAVANKVGALYSRAEIRDYLDVDSIRQSGVFSDAQLLELAADHDPGFEQGFFSDQLSRIVELTDKDVAEYRVGAEQLAGITGRLTAWARDLKEP